MLQLKIETVFCRSLPEIIETKEKQKGKKEEGRVIQIDKAALGCDECQLMLNTANIVQNKHHNHQVVSCKLPVLTNFCFG